MKKFNLAVVHAGFDKTGSTAIQSAMDSSREALLRDESIAYLPGRWQAELGSYFYENEIVYTGGF